MRSAALVLLHGTGGCETDLLDLGRALAPAARSIGIRGAVECADGGYAFFRRFPDRRVDHDDVATRVGPLSERIESAVRDCGSISRPVVVGFSNGAIMAAALLLSQPDMFAAAILFRPLPPFADGRGKRLDGVPVLILDGEWDDRRAPGDGARVAVELGALGAGVDHTVSPAGHAVTDEEVVVARHWLEARN